MQVYLELALIENFCMDFCLLYACRWLSKTAIRTRNLIISSIVGAIIAVIFPLLNLSGALAQMIKFSSAFLICATTKKFASVKSYLKFCAIFILLTFVLGGALFAIFTFADVNFVAGQGYFISPLPVGIPLFFATVVAIFCRAIAKKYKPKTSANLVKTIIRVGKTATVCDGFFDSGNSVYYKGCPVSVVPLALIKNLIDVRVIKQFVLVTTVAGSNRLPIIFIDGITVEYQGKNKEIKDVAIAISDRAQSVILHPDFLEDFK